MHSIFVDNEIIDTKVSSTTTAIVYQPHETKTIVYINKKDMKVAVRIITVS
jgi:hypothetical protein